MKAGDGDPCDGRHTRVIDILKAIETSGNGLHQWMWHGQQRGGDGLYTGIRQKANKADMVRVCHKLPNQEGGADEICYEQSQLFTLVLMQNFHWPCDLLGTQHSREKQSRRFLEYVAEKLLTQLVSKAVREGGHCWTCCSGPEKGWQVVEELEAILSKVTIKLKRFWISE